MGKINMFEWLNKQGVKSTQGFIVQFTGRFSVEYQEGDKKILIELNDGFSAGRFCILIRADSFSKWNDGTPISLEKQKEILRNFTEAVEFQSIGVIVE